MALPKTLKGFTAFVDGFGYLGRLNSGKLPKQTIKTDEHKDGGMDLPVELDMGMEKLEAELVFSEFSADVFATFGRTDVPITVRGSQESEDGLIEAIEAHFYGLAKEVDPGEWKAGDKGECKLSLSPRYYRLTIGGRVVTEIDAENMIRVIDGVDQLAARRQALGV